MSKNNQFDFSKETSLVAKELWQVCSKYIDFGKWYQGAKKRKTRS